MREKEELGTGVAFPALCNTYKIDQKIIIFSSSTLGYIYGILKFEKLRLGIVFVPFNFNPHEHYTVDWLMMVYLVRNS